MQNWEGNKYLSENWFSKNKILSAADNHNYMCHMCAKGFLHSNLSQALITKIPIFMKLP